MRVRAVFVCSLLSGCLGGTPELRGLWSGGGAPSRVGVVAQIVDGDDFGITDIQSGEISVSIDGAPASEVTVYSGEALHMRTPLTLLIDQSQGTLTAEAAPALRDLANAILGDLPAEQPARLLVFSDEVVELSDYTTDRAALADAVAELGTARGAITDLHGALLTALDGGEQLDMAMGIVWGLTVVITDGGDGPVVVSASDVIEARGDAALLAIDVEDGQAGELANLGALRVRKSEDLAARSEELRNSIRAALGSTVLVSVCSEERSGEHSVELLFERDRLKASWLGDFSASGFDDVALWDAATPLPELMLEAQTAYNGAGVFIAGGDGEGSVYYSPVRADGLLASWSLATSLPEGSLAGVAATESALYAINGPYAAFAALDADGLPGEWVEMDSPGYASVLRVWSGHLWSISRDAAYVGPIGSDGAAGPWTASEPFPEGLDGGLGMAIAGGTMVVVGNVGRGNDWTPTAYASRLGADGSFGAWQQLPGFPAYLGYWLTADSDGEAIYVFPGDDADGPEVYSATVSDSGVGAWQVAGRMGEARDQYATVIVEDRLFLLGGAVGGDSTTSGVAGGVSGGQLGFDCSF